MPGGAQPWKYKLSRAIRNKRWHILREDWGLIVARRVPVRFDVSAEARFAPVRKLPLAHQIRQDLWRALQAVRGFAPVVQVRDAEGGVVVRAGGQVDGRFDRAKLNARIAEMLAHPPHIARWLRWAR